MARPRKAGPRTASGRLSRAQRRIALRTAANALARGAVELVEEPIKPRRCRHKTQLELLEGRGAISRQQQAAGERICRDYIGSGSLLGRVTLNWDRLGSALQGRARPGGNDSPGAIAARGRYDAAMKALGPWLAPIVVHVAVTDLPAAEWGPLNGHAKEDGVPLLRLALTALHDHYGRRRPPA